MTTIQLKKEKEHIDNFKIYICPAYGLAPILDWGTGAKNKKENCDADVTVKVVNDDLAKKLKFPNIKLGSLLTVSLKTKGGNFTIANGGTGKGAYLFKEMNLRPFAKQKFEKTKNAVKKIKNQFGKDNRWKEIGEEKKLAIKELYVNLFWALFHVPQYQRCLYEWLNSRQADLKCVGDELFIPEKKILPENIVIDIISDNTIRVGHYRLRVKSSGGKVGSTWKINYEITP